MANAVPVPEPSQKDLARFKKKYSILPSGCWEWTGAKFQNGYGIFFLDGKLRRAHRISYVWANGELSSGYSGLDHVCNNRACVNPDHLRPSLAIENVLRGDGPTATNAGKTHCARGHEFTEENTYVNPRGERQCRICLRAATERHYDTNRERILAKRRAARDHITYEPRPCPKCGAIFTPERSTARYCTNRDCINARQRENRNKRLGR